MTYWVVNGEKKKSVYHTDKECTQVQGELTERTEIHVKRMDLELCNRCEGNGNDYPETQKKALRYQV